MISHVLCILHFVPRTFYKTFYLNLLELGPDDNSVRGQTMAFATNNRLNKLIDIALNAQIINNYYLPKNSALFM